MPLGVLKKSVVDAPAIAVNQPNTNKSNVLFVPDADIDASV